MKKLLYISFMMLLCGYLSAQELSNYREQIFAVDADTIQIDTVSIVPGSAIVEALPEERLIPQQDYIVLAAEGLLVWINKPLAAQVNISYRIFPFSFTKPRFHKDYEKIKEQQAQEGTPYIYAPDIGGDLVFDFGGIDYNGSFSRGITVGNKQDLSINSSLNLQLSGKVTEDVEVVAALTDDNIPIQPQGNTQQIQEFDKVFVQFRIKERTIVTAGDYELFRSPGYFMRINKKVAGADIATAFDWEDKGQLKSGLSLAINKGKYRKMEFMGQEGNQGPYRLTGADGEQFIMVLAGTERVYIDGELLQRGDNRDYIIDYNTGEITFTPNRLITKDKRITIEFEYSNQFYSRSLLLLQNEYKKDRLKLRLNLLTEQDSKNKPLFMEFDKEEKEVLRRVGDSIHRAVLPSARDTSFLSDRVMYKKIDTTVNGIDTAIYVFSDDPDSARYIVSFSNVGEGRGNYIIAPTSLNARVFQWVPPVNGVPQGSYEPVTVLITPKNHQMMTVGADYEFSERSALTTEVAVSNQDENTLSPLHDADDKGVAARTGFKNILPLKTEEEKPVIQLTTTVDYEYVNKNFRPLEQYRSIEFTRDWNLDQRIKNLDEHLGRTTFNLIKKDLGNISYGFSTFIKDTAYQGFKNYFGGNLQKNGFDIKVNGSYLITSSLNTASQFFRPKVDISKTFAALKGWKAGIYGEQEDNKRSIKNSDSLLNTSFRHDLIQVYFENPDTAANRFHMDYSRRWDYAPVNDEFTLSTVGNIFNIAGDLLRNKNHRLSWNFKHRSLNVQDTALVNERDEESVLGRTEYTLNLFKGFIRSQTLYEVGSGQERRIEYRYNEVEPGNGLYIWNDDGDDKQELDEFELAITEDQIATASFIRLYFLTDEYFRVKTLQFNEVINITPKALWHKEEGLKKTASLFALRSAYQLNRKTSGLQGFTPYNPFYQPHDTVLSLLSSNVRNTLYFNRFSSKFSIDVDQLSLTNLRLLTGGFDEQIRQEQSIHFRWNMSRSFSSDLTFALGDRKYTSGAFPQKNYDIDNSEIEPELTYQYKNRFRIKTGYGWKNSRNAEAFGGENAVHHNFSAEGRLNTIGKGVINVKASYVNILFTGKEDNTSVAFTMLEGLQPGSNYIWSVGVERKLADHIQMSFNYNGRKSEGNDMIHVGRAQIRAVF